ncbi:DUF4913 domain-containing protein [Streptomyces sp. NPDC005486]|uniref:DUF4913 domain-containing protein n=1 Tax=Streptomyces sp. NPDC005486 TaxID=3155345 RepID=UPI0033BA1726
MTENDRAWAFGGTLFGGALTLSAASWAGAAAGAALTGDDVAAASPLTVYRMATDFAGVWPHSQTASAIGAALVDVAVVALVVWGLRLALRWFRNPSDLATLHQMRELAPKQAARNATRLRASLKDAKPKTIKAADRGVLLGLWFDHPVAVARLHACWLAWQESTDPATCGYTGPSVWHRDHLDPCLRELRASGGPFQGCTKSANQVNHRLPGLVPSAWRHEGAGQRRGPAG